MSIFQGIILGIIQGLTEFLPVSSSAHLVLVPYLLQWRLDADSAFVFDVIVQLGTLAAVIIYFWKDLLAIIQAMLAALKAGQPSGWFELLGWWIVLPPSRQACGPPPKAGEAARQPAGHRNIPLWYDYMTWPRAWAGKTAAWAIACRCVTLPFSALAIFPGISTGLPSAAACWGFRPRCGSPVLFLDWCRS